MSREIKDIKDKNTGQLVYPRTHVSAIVVDDNHNLEQILSPEVVVSESEPFGDNAQVWIVPEGDDSFNYVEEAPADGTMYGRRSGQWKKISIPNLVSKLESHELEELKFMLGLTGSTVEEAPEDSNYYARKNGTWVNSSLNSLAASLTEDSKASFLETVGAAEGCQIVNHGIEDTTMILSPNKYHIWDTVETLNLTLPSTNATSLKVYAFQFTSGATPTTLNITGLIGWMVEDFEIGANKTYQVTIMNGYGAIGGLAV